MGKWNKHAKVETVADFTFLGSKIMADGDCSHKIKGHLLLARKAMTNLNSVLQSGDITADQGPYSQIYGFSRDHVWMCELDHKECCQSIQLLSCVQLFATPWYRSTRGLPVHHWLPEFTQTHVRWVSDAIQPSYPLHPLLLLPSIFPSIRVYSKESVLYIRWPKNWSFSFSINPSNEYSGLISFRMDWLNLLAVQRILKGLLQYHSSKASVLQCSAFFILQLLYPYMTTGKTIALTRWTFVGKVISLLLNMLSRLVITFFQGVSVF